MSPVRPDTPISNLDALLDAAIARGPFAVAVACGDDEAAERALAMAESCGLARGLLVGSAADEAAAVAEAVRMVREGKAQILLKGRTTSGTLLKAVLDRDRGLRDGRLLSDSFVFEHDGRLLCVTDGGINVAPDLAAKRQILENAVALYHALGVPRPRVAVMSAVETAIPGHAASEDAVALVELARRGEIEGCDVEGPLSLDLAISPQAAAKKGHRGAVAGRADILLCPDFVSANLLAKATTWFGVCRLAHVVMGASAPVLIPSRSDSAEAKLFSIALGGLAWISDHSRRVSEVRH